MAKTTQEKAAYAQKVQTRVEELFKELMPEVPLVKVLTKPDTDWEYGDDILDITVVFDSTKTLDADKMNELSSRVWRQRDGENGDPIPVFYFTSRPDARELGLVS